MNETKKVLLVIGAVLAAMIVLSLPMLMALGFFAMPVSSVCTGLDKLLYQDHAIDNGEATISLAAPERIENLACSVSGTMVSYGATCTCNPKSVGVGDTFTCTSSGANAFGGKETNITITYTSAASGSTETETASCYG